MTSREQFYATRDARTRSYGVDLVQLEQPVGIVVGRDAAVSPNGQAAALALVNLLARVHRRIRLWSPDAGLHTRALVPANSFAEACVATALAIDPFQDVTVQTLAGFDSDVPSIGIGEQVPAGCLTHAGGDGFVGIINNQPVPLTDLSASSLGLGLGVCLAAGELFRAVFGQPTRVRRISLWGFDEGDTATPGPVIAPGPLDVGDVAVVGAGAVASAFCYWAAQLGHLGQWTLIDGDRAELHNTNRCMGLFAADAGWPNGRRTGAPAAKATCAANLISNDYYAGWYHEWLENCPAERPDLILPLANDFDVRHAIGQRGEPILVHATTSPNWTAELHRHIAGRDDCIDCRLPSRRTTSFRCSTGPTPTDNEDPHGQSDAALPFLSGAAGLLLLAGLVQLEHGTFEQHTKNHWRLLFGTGERAWSRSTYTCTEECRTHIPTAVRRSLNRGRRWADLDTEDKDGD